MRIGIDARLYKKGLGIGRYIEQLLIHLESIPSDDEFVIFLRKDMMQAYAPSSRRFKKVCMDVGWYSFAEQLIVPIVMYAQRLDMAHFPHFNVPILYPGRYIVTIHDILMLRQKQSSRSAASTRHWLIHWVKYQCYRIVLRIACKRACAVIAVSKTVKNDLINVLSIPGTSVEVVTEGVKTFRKQSNIPLPSVVRHPYYLNVGNAYPHKNISILLDVFELIKNTEHPHMLVLCGQEDFFQKRLQKEIMSRGLESVVVHLGYVSDQQLAALYQHAAGAIFPSLEEGFGFGPLEAASAGVPVIVSDISCFHETLDNAALFIDPQNPHAIIAAITTLESDPEKRNDLIDAGMRRVELFSWTETARKTHELYSRV